MSGWSGLSILVGLGALATCGSTAAIAAVVAVVTLLARRWLVRFGTALQALSVPVFLGCIGGVWLGLPVREAVSLGLVVLLVPRQIGRTGPTDDRLVLLLTGLLVVLAATSEITLLNTLLAVLWGLALPGALQEAVVSELPRRPAVGPTLGVITLLGSLLLYPLVPRLGSGESDTPWTGFSDEIRLDAFEELATDSSEVLQLRVEGPRPDGPIYLRGTALDRFDGTRWSSAAARAVDGSVRVGGLAGVVPEGQVRLRITQEPLPEGVLFTSGVVRRLASTATPVERDSYGGYFGPPDIRVQYAMFVEPPLGPQDTPVPLLSSELGEGDRLRLTGLPDDVDPRIVDLAAETAGEGEHWTQVLALRDHLRSEYRYTLAPGITGRAPLSSFLFGERAGHCEYYASALAVMARSQGIPARLVTGFAGGVWDEASQVWRIRRQDAHAWVEVHVDGGWVAVDPTPGPASAVTLVEPSVVERLQQRLDRAFRDLVLNLDGDRQAEAARTMGTAVERPLGLDGEGVFGVWLVVLLGGLGASVAAALGMTVLERASGEAPPPPSGRVEGLYRKARRRLEANGWRVPVVLPPVEAAQWVRERADEPEAEALEALAWLLYRVRLGGEDEGPLIPEAKRLTRRMERVGPPGR